MISWIVYVYLWLITPAWNPEIPIAVSFNSKYEADDYTNDLDRRLYKAVQTSPTAESFGVTIGNTVIGYNSIVAYKIITKKNEPQKIKNEILNTKKEDTLM